jgi:hypothetical protein
MCTDFSNKTIIVYTRINLIHFPHCDRTLVWTIWKHRLIPWLNLQSRCIHLVVLLSSQEIKFAKSYFFSNNKDPSAWQLLIWWPSRQDIWSACGQGELRMRLIWTCNFNNFVPKSNDWINTNRIISLCGFDQIVSRFLLAMLSSQAATVTSSTSLSLT